MSAISRAYERRLCGHVEGSGADFDAPIPSLEIVSFGGAACVNRSGNIECYLIPAAMSRGHRKVERIILQVLNWGKPRDRGRWSMGADA